ncbi:MAG: pyridoxal-dependent decarboxylase [Zoogloea sp.]|nr:pyridoxal-dependent decarboxylase [Zoogloea sp.]
MPLQSIKNLVKHAVVSYARLADIANRNRLGLSSHDLRPENWDASMSRGGHLEIGGLDAVALAEIHGTPLHVVDSSRLRRNLSNFQEGFRFYYPRVEVAYSYKTNPLPGVLGRLHRFGASAEVISAFELWLALELGVPPERIVVNGPGKTPEMLECAVSRKVKIINVDNIDEPAAIQRFAKRHGHIQQVGVRVVTSVGWASQFGLRIASGAAFRAFREIRRHDHLDGCGLHVHLGTGLRDVASYLQAVREVLDFADLLRRELGVRIRFLDLGGGFGVPTVRPYSSLDLWLMAAAHPPTVLDIRATPSIGDYGRGIAALVREYFPESELPTLILEPGRAITSSAQSLLLRVLSVKPGDGGPPSVIVDGGINVAMPTRWEYHEILAADKLNLRCDTSYRVCGPLCHPGDVLAQVKRLPELEPGDLIAVMDAGAYFIPNQMNFSNPRAAAIMVEHGKARPIRRREEFAHLISLDEAQFAFIDDSDLKSA